VPPGGLSISADGRQATLEMKKVVVIDQPKWPALDAQTMPAIMSFRVVWKALEEKVVFFDKAKHFRFDGYRAMVQAEAEVEVPSIGFSWKSDPLATSSASFGIIGRETNGKYYDQ
jgi:hypothetical protein